MKEVIRGVGDEEGWMGRDRSQIVFLQRRRRQMKVIKGVGHEESGQRKNRSEMHWGCRRM